MIIAVVKRPREDGELSNLGQVLSSFLPMGRIRNPHGMGMRRMHDLMAHHIFGNILPPGMIPDMDNPGGETQISITPQGINVSKVRSVHRSFVNGIETGERDTPLHSNPMEALLELLYAKAGAVNYEPKMQDYIEGEAKEALGTPTYKKLHDFIEEAKTGKVTMKTPEGKTITVIIGNTEDDEKILTKKKEILSKASGGMHDYIKAADTISKTAALDLHDIGLLSGSELQKMGLVQTDMVGLLKNLREIMGTFEDEDEDFLKSLHNNLLNEYNSGVVSCNDSDDQEKMVAILNHIFDEDGEGEAAKSLVFNTKRPVSKEVIIHIEGHPVDTSKLVEMTKDEATKRYTPSLANYIYDEEAGKVTPEAIRSFLKKIESIGKDPSKKDMVDMLHERLTSALFDELTPDEDDLAEETLEEC